MSYLLVYNKVTVPFENGDSKTFTLVLPDSSNMETQVQAQELCTLADGRTVVSVNDGVELPEQQAEIADSVEVLPTPLPDELRAEICAISPHVWIINERVGEKIRAMYSVDEEFKVLRLREAEPERFAAYNAHVEACRQWGREQKAALGL